MAFRLARICTQNVARRASRLPLRSGRVLRTPRFDTMMMKLILHAAFWSAAFALPLAAESELLHCARAHALLAAADSPDYRKYAPSREIDILHLTLDVTPDFKARTIFGKAVLRFKPIARPLDELKLDGVDLRVRTVAATEKILGWQATEKQVIITFDKPIPA